MDKKTVKLQIWDTAGQVSSIFCVYVANDVIDIIKDLYLTDLLTMNTQQSAPINKLRNDSEPSPLPTTEEPTASLWFMTQPPLIHLTTSTIG